MEATYSFLKTQYNLAIHKIRGLGNIASFALFRILCLVLNREAAENTGRSVKSVSPTYSKNNIGTRQCAQIARLFRKTLGEF